MKKILKCFVRCLHEAIQESVGKLTKVWNRSGTARIPWPVENSKALNSSWKALMRGVWIQAQEGFHMLFSIYSLCFVHQKVNPTPCRWMGRGWTWRGLNGVGFRTRFPLGCVCLWGFPRMSVPASESWDGSAAEECGHYVSWTMTMGIIFSLLGSVSQLLI